MASLPQSLALQVRRTLKSPAPDPVHDLRVAIRRYNQSLALNSQNRNKNVRRLLKQTMERAGDVRNLDIALKLVAKIKGASMVRRRLQTRRREAAAALTAHLTDHFQGWAAEGFPGITPGKAERGHNGSLLEAVRRMFKYARKSRQAKQLHKLRIAVKKLRYTVELIDPGNAHLDQIKQLQSELGKINDFRTTRAILKSEPHGEAVRQELKRRQQSKIRGFRRRWAVFFADPASERTWLRGFSGLRARPPMRASARTGETRARESARDVA